MTSQLSPALQMEASEAFKQLGLGQLGFPPNLAAHSPPQETIESTCVKVMYVPEVFNWKDTWDELATYGEIARLDVNMVATLGCVLVTYFDVRSSRWLLQSSGARAAIWPAATHCFRAVRIPVTVFVKAMKDGLGLASYGEVANIDINRGNVVVEFFDMRAAQQAHAFLSCEDPRVTQYPLTTQQQQEADRSSGLVDELLKLVASTEQAGGMEQCLSGAPGLGCLGSPTLPATHQELGMLQAPAQVGLVKPRAGPLPVGKGGGKKGPQASKFEVDAQVNGHANKKEELVKQEAALSANGAKGREATSKVLRTKVAKQDFSKFDINPTKIANGDDKRTTVMIRNLVAAKSRQEFLNFLKDCNLDKRFTFFYMPCKEHRNTPVGFAFVNFISAQDILKIDSALRAGLWRDTANKPALSYARFQGHEQLESHFSSSAVLHEHDEEKRPMFCKANVEIAAQMQAQRQMPEVQQQKQGKSRNAGVGKRFSQPMKVPQQLQQIMGEDPTMEPAFLPLPRPIMAATADFRSTSASSNSAGSADSFGSYTGGEVEWNQVPAYPNGNHLQLLTGA